MFEKVLRKQEQQANQQVSEREKVLTAKVDDIIKALKDGDFNCQEVVLILKNAEMRLNSAMGSKKFSELI